MHIYFKEEMFSYESLIHAVASTKYVKVTRKLLVSLQHGSTLTNIRWVHNTTCTGTPHSFISDFYKQQPIVFRQFKLFQNSKFPSFVNYIIFYMLSWRRWTPGAGADNLSIAKTVPENSAPAAGYWTVYSKKPFALMCHFKNLDCCP